MSKRRYHALLPVQAQDELRRAARPGVSGDVTVRRVDHAAGIVQRREQAQALLQARLRAARLADLREVD